MGAFGLAVGCDYVFLDEAIVPKQHPLETWTIFRTANKEPDHRPTRLVCRVTSFAQSPVHRRRRAVYDRTAVYNAISATDPESLATKALLEDYVVRMPSIVVPIEPTTHRQLLADYLCSGLGNLLPAVHNSAGT